MTPNVTTLFQNEAITSRRLKIDLHTHILPATIPDLASKYGNGEWIKLLHGNCPNKEEADMFQGDKFFRRINCNCWSTEKRISECDSADVDVQVLSTVPVMFSYWANPTASLDLAQFLNNHIADCVRKNPKRFTGLGTVPMQDPTLAVQEMNRCMTELGLVGIQIGTHINEWNLDAPELDTFWQRAEELQVPIFIHPWSDSNEVPERQKPYWGAWLVGMPCETTTAMCAVTMGGVLDRFPSLKLCFAHGGGSFLATLGRIDHGYRVRPDLCAHKSKHPPSYYLPQLYVDSLVHDDDTLKFIIRKIGAEHILLGSDYPFPLGEVDRPGKLVEESNLAEDVKDLILWKNACKFLNLDPLQFQ